MVDMVLCNELFLQGRRQFIVGDFEAALKSLSEACSKMAAEKGDTADELFEPYLYYAKALYAYQKLSPDVIGDVVPDITSEEQNNKEVEQLGTVAVEEVSTSSNNVEKQNSDHASNIFEEQDENKKDDYENKDEDETKEEDETKDEDETKENDNGDEQNENVSEDLLKEDIDEHEETGEEEEDVGYLQMSYETIECAKLIIKRQLAEKVLEEKILDCKMADCCDVEGDIYIEEEVMDEAITQYETALKLRLKHLSSCDRTIAESYYKIAVAYNIDYRSREAKDNFIKCRDILKIHRDDSVKKKEDAGELEDILADIEEKILESEESEKECERAKENLREFMSLAQVPSTTESSDISHLVRKRKTDNDDEASFKKQSKKEEQQ